MPGNTTSFFFLLAMLMCSIQHHGCEIPSFVNARHLWVFLYVFLTSPEREPMRRS